MKTYPLVHLPTNSLKSESLSSFASPGPFTSARLTCRAFWFAPSQCCTGIRFEDCCESVTCALLKRLTLLAYTSRRTHTRTHTHTLHLSVQLRYSHHCVTVTFKYHKCTSPMVPLRVRVFARVCEGVLNVQVQVNRDLTDPVSRSRITVMLITLP